MKKLLTQFVTTEESMLASCPYCTLEEISLIQKLQAINMQICAEHEPPPLYHRLNVGKNKVYLTKGYEK